MSEPADKTDVLPEADEPTRPVAVPVVVHVFETQSGIYRVQRTPRMVLMRNRGAEHRENAVARRLDNVPIVPMHCIYHELQYRVDDCARLLRIEVPHEFRRAFHVGEQQCDLLALAFEGLFREQNALCQVLGVYYSGDETGRRWRGQGRHWSRCVRTA